VYYEEFAIFDMWLTFGSSTGMQI